MPSGSVDLAGKITNQSGNAKVGLTVSLWTAANFELAKDGGAQTAEATDTTDADGRWNFDTQDITETFIVAAADGTKQILIDARNKIQLTNIDLIDDLSVDTIYEHTAAAGVTIDGVVLKDSGATFAGDVIMNAAAVRWSAGVAVVAGEYSLQQDDSTVLHANVPTGATFEWSVNDVAEMTLSASTLGLASNTITAIGNSGSQLLASAWTMVGGAEQNLLVETTGASISAILRAKIPASGTGTAALLLYQGTGDGSANNKRYQLSYDGSNSLLRLRSEDIDGSATTGNVLTVADGTDDVMFSGGISTDGESAPTSGIATNGTLDMNSNSITEIGNSGSQLLADAWTMVSANANRLTVETTATDQVATLTLKVAASSSGSTGPAVNFHEGAGTGAANNMLYQLGYDPGSNFLYLFSADIDGSSTDADIWRVPDGQTTIDANTTWDENVFDEFDDAMVLSPCRQGVMNLGARKQELIEMGVLRVYKDGWVGYNDQRMAALLAGGIYQSRARMDAQYAEHETRFASVDERFEAVEEANRILREQLETAGVIPAA